MQCIRMYAIHSDVCNAFGCMQSIPVTHSSAQLHPTLLYTHTQTHTQTRTHAHAQKQTQTQTYAHRQTYILTHTILVFIYIYIYFPVCLYTGECEKDLRLERMMCFRCCAYCCNMLYCNMLYLIYCNMRYLSSAATCFTATVLQHTLLRQCCNMLTPTYFT